MYSAFLQFMLAFLLFHTSSSDSLNGQAQNVKNPASRIVNGYPASRGEFPYQTALLLTISNVTHLCGGALIASNWVITAAHCVVSVTSGTAILGILSLSQTNDRVVALVDSINIHPNYSLQNVENDLALLRLSTNVTSNEVVRPIALASDDSTLSDGSYVRVSGWGKIRDADNEISEILNYVGLTTISNVECAQFYGDVIQEPLVCAEGASTQSICDGDTGSPLVAGGGNSSVLVGVASFFSNNGCDRGSPSAFTRIANYRAWIRSITGI